MRKLNRKKFLEKLADSGFHFYDDGKGIFIRDRAGKRELAYFGRRGFEIYATTPKVYIRDFRDIAGEYNILCSIVNGFATDRLEEDVKEHFDDSNKMPSGARTSNEEGSWVTDFGIDADGSPKGVAYRGNFN